MILPMPEKRKECLHARAKAPIGHCKECGKPTRSHVLDEMVTDAVECPDCGAPVIVVVQAVLCHVCFEKAKAPEEL